MSPVSDLEDAWWQIQRIKDELARDRVDRELMLRHLAALEQRVARLESLASR